MSLGLNEAQKMQANWNLLNAAISGFDKGEEQAKVKASKALDVLGKKALEFSNSTDTRRSSSTSSLSENDSNKVDKNTDSSEDLRNSSSTAPDSSEFQVLSNDERIFLINAASVLDRLLTSIENALKKNEEISEQIQWHYWLANTIFQKLEPYANLFPQELLSRSFWCSLNLEILKDNRGTTYKLLDDLGKNAQALFSPLHGTKVSSSIEPVSENKSRKKITKPNFPSYTPTIPFSSDEPEHLYTTEEYETNRYFLEQASDLLKHSKSNLDRLLTSVEEALKKNEKLPEKIKLHYWLANTIFQKLGLGVNSLPKELLSRFFWSVELLPQKEFNMYRKIFIEDPFRAIGAMADKYFNGDPEKTISHPLSSALSCNAYFAAKILLARNPKYKNEEYWRLILNHSTPTLLRIESLKTLINYEKRIKKEVTDASEPFLKISIFPGNVLLIIDAYIRSDKIRAQRREKSEAKKRLKVRDVLPGELDPAIQNAILETICSYIVVTPTADISAKALKKLKKTEGEETPKSCLVM